MAIATLAGRHDVDYLWHPATGLVLLHAVMIASVGMRVVMMRPLPSVALAWLFLVALLPGLGLLAYVAFGERRLGGRRARRLAELRQPFVLHLRNVLHRAASTIEWQRVPPACEAMNRLGLSLAGIPTLAGNALELLSGADVVLRAITEEIDGARRSVHLEFYIWHEGGLADEVVAAVARAAQRGVACRILVDALGSRAWLAGPHPERLRAVGVAIVAAMPIGPVRALFRRNDLRNHRKIAVVDDAVAFTGSMNLVDPRFFGADAEVGAWVDAMVRLRGPAVEALHGVLLSDWFLETAETIEQLMAGEPGEAPARAGTANVHVLPSGPIGSEDALLQMILVMLYAARRSIVVTTPYFVPDEAMLRALRSAAVRGVTVTILVPALVDSFFVRHASRSYYADLMAAGVRLHEYRGGLLHTKSIVVDGEITMFGTANLDMRSLWLNYEVSLFVYDAGFGARMQALQGHYLAACTPVDPVAWRARSLPRRMLENLARLLSPLL